MTTLVNPAPKGVRGRGWIPGTHRGVDFGFYNADPEGTKINVAAAAGTVVSVYGGGGYNGGWGNLVIIDHGGGFFTAYAHFRTGTITVKVGDRVAAGHSLGKMGSTGNVTGDHLHFEVRLGGAGAEFRVDPSPWLDGKELPGTEAPPIPGGQRTVRPNVGAEGYLNGRTAPNLSGQVVQKLQGGEVGNFDGFIRGQQVTVDGVTSDIWFRGAFRGAFRGNFFAAAGFTSQDTAGLADLGTDSGSNAVPMTEWFDVGNDGQYFYYQLGNALAGNYDASQLLPPNTSYRVIGNSGQGPKKVASPKGEVWVGTRNHPAVTVWR